MQALYNILSTVGSFDNGNAPVDICAWTHREYM